ncbi:transmembrane amino acid transporter protein-domain-containing protein [Halenospora varia]|nr:transmembrane amino acid transporter protein-domain-containing protein [Halenospora varia]
MSANATSTSLSSNEIKSEEGLITPASNNSQQPDTEKGEVGKDDEFEVFKKTKDGVDFRTVGWFRASIIFLKVQFALGVLSIPTSMYALGALGGALSVVGWGALNTYGAIVQGSFRNRHAGCHTIADMANVVGGKWLKEICGFLFVIAYILCTGAGILGISTGINALSHHAACTVYWSVIATVAIAVGGSVRKFHTIGWITWAGFVSIFIAVLIVVIAVTTRDRPAAAPQTGAFDLGYYIIAHPTFIAGMSASATIFISSSGSSAFIPVIAEMKNPRDYRKAVYVCMAVVNAAYLSFGLVVYRWCGQWVASPSLGSAGQTIKMVAYGIGMIGLIASAVVYLHIAAKYIFVRILRNSPHLQSNSLIHWSTWLGCTFGLSFILAEAIPIFNYLLALTGSICFAPLALILPGWFWIHDHGAWRKGEVEREGESEKLGKVGRMATYWFHWVFFVLLGCFLMVAGTYATVVLIIDAYKAGTIGSAFSCADNSNSS